MKKITYLISIFFMVALMSTSCEKEDPIVPDAERQITLPELEGTWISTQYDYEGISYIDCSNLIDATNNDVKNGDFMLIDINIKSVDSDWNLESQCTNLILSDGNKIEYEVNTQELVFKSAGVYVIKFKVKSYDVENEILKLEITEEYVGGVGIPIGGIYTLHKTRLKKC